MPLPLAKSIADQRTNGPLKLLFQAARLARNMGAGVSVPARLIVPAHRVATVKSEECLKWCADTLRRGVAGQYERSVYLLLFDDWEDAALFQRTWL
jgi:hypothetical protein